MTWHGLRHSKACYDPRESTKMWERMSESEKGSGSGLANMDFMSTHPANSKRIKVSERERMGLSRHWPFLRRLFFSDRLNGLTMTATERLDARGAGCTGGYPLRR